jgi:hypothetical protein
MSMTSSGRRPPGLAATIWLYALVRVAMVALVAGLLVLAGVPLLIAVLAGLIVALPLSMVLFRGLRARLDEALAQARERRSGERAALRGRLRGGPPTGTSPTGTAATEALRTGTARVESPAADLPATGPATADQAPTDSAADSDQRPAEQHAQAQADRGEH